MKINIKYNHIKPLIIQNGNFKGVKGKITDFEFETDFLNIQGGLCDSIYTFNTDITIYAIIEIDGINRIKVKLSDIGEEYCKLEVL